MATPRILVTSSRFPELGLRMLAAKCDVIQSKLDGFGDNAANRAEIERMIKDIDGVVWCTTVPLNKAIIDRFGSRLKVVSVMGAGVDHIDQAELKARGIKLGHTPNVLNAAVADCAVFHMIAASRRIKEGLEQVESGRWFLGMQGLLGTDLSGSTVGIIGLGKIGQAIAQRLAGFEIQKIIYTGNKPKPEADRYSASYVSLDELLKQSDFIIVSCLLNDNTRNLIDSDAFSKMKSNAVLVNISRGGVIDQDALIEALKNRRIFAAGLDVTSPEPLPADSPLIGLPNCFITPHLGTATVNTRDKMSEIAALNALSGVFGEKLPNPVN